MAGTFRTFREVLAKGNPQELKDVMPRMVEVVEWHENPESKGSGECRIAYFELPKLGQEPKGPILRVVPFVL